MAGDSYPVARFDHVTKTGSLVFTVDGTPFAVNIDETLERAMLEAKQLRSEQHVEEAPQQQRTLPISQIQALIRAGMDPDQVAERYDLSPILVRRFSSAVESEKSYAIEQFLRVPAPKESRMRSLGDVIERTFAAARVRRDDVSWKATRRGLEPWRIIASFTSAGHPIHAEWSWNMHDNSVVCINNAARKLIGETSPSAAVAAGEQDDVLDDAIPTSITLPGDSARSARIEQTVAAWGQRGGTPTAQQPKPQRKSQPAPIDVPLPQQPAQPEGGSTPAPNPAPSGTAQSQASGNATTPAPAAAPAADTTAQEHEPTHAHADKDTRKSSRHRPPVPSWDEIMFGKPKA
ncbi:septation protein SepH [Bifidobacterium criceti]|uniref:DNA-binding protein n=1 Tax=Bifidobacterium criceti TaxID=1960969 RepID=A0A2A2EDI9_9BIFI|nr:septation protein SepH [Bifidobacterium criceti]PAU67093.1 DNA-binding protein [Bifidobacterium criceti]